MDLIRAAEILVYLLLVSPRDLFSPEEQGPLRDWCVHKLREWSSIEEREVDEIADSFVLFVSRLQIDLGMTPQRDSLRFTDLQTFLWPKQSREDLVAERMRLIAALARIDQTLNTRDLYAIDRSTLPVVSSTSRDLALPSTGQESLPPFHVYRDFKTFLAEPGFDPLDSDTIGKLLTRDTGA
jgi:hypothetical protein